MFALNLPNILTLLRILLVPVLVVVLLGETENGDLWAAIVFALANPEPEIDPNVRPLDGARTSDSFSLPRPPPRHGSAPRTPSRRSRDRACSSA